MGRITAPRDGHALIPKAASYLRRQGGLCRCDQVKNPEVGRLSWPTWTGQVVIKIHGGEAEKPKSERSRVVIKIHEGEAEKPKSERSRVVIKIHKEKQRSQSQRARVTVEAELQPRCLEGASRLARSLSLSLSLSLGAGKGQARSSPLDLLERVRLWIP